MTPPDQPATGRGRDLYLLCLLLFVLAAATTVALWPSLHSTVIDENFTFPSGGTADQPGPRQLWELLAAVRGGGFQPLTWVSLCVDRAAWGTHPLAYHATSLALHVANVLLVYWLGLRLLSMVRPTWLRHVGACLAALLFALHPLRVEPVAWVAQRGVLLAAFFALLTALFFIRACAGGRGWWVAGLLGYAASLACGPWAAALPLVLLALDAYPLQRRGLLRILGEKVPFAVLACAAIIAGLRTVSPGFVARLVLVAYGFFFYLWKTVWPDALLPIYELPQPMKLLAPYFLAALGGLVILLALLAYYARRVPALAVAAISYLLLLLPAVLFIQAGIEEAGDRYSYLASVPCMLVLGAGLARLWSLPGRDTRAAATVVTLLGVGIASALGVLTWRQAQVWRTPATLWNYADKLAPHSALVSFRLGQEAEQAGEFERAVQFYRSAADIRPGFLAAQLALGNALLHELNLEGAVAAYRRVLAIKPRNAEAHFQLGAALAAAGQFAPAEQELKQAAALAPADIRPRKALGHLFMMLSRFPEAVEAFQGALAVAPHDTDLQYNLGRAERAARQTTAPTTTSQAAEE